MHRVGFFIEDNYCQKTGEVARLLLFWPIGAKRYFTMKLLTQLALSDMRFIR